MRCPLISSYEREEWVDVWEVILPHHNTSEIGAAHDIWRILRRYLCTLDKGNAVLGECIEKQIISVGKLPRYIKVKNPLTLAVFHDMLINIQALLSHVKAPTRERGLLFQWIICPWNVSVNPNHIKMLHIPMWCTNIHSADLTAHWDTWYDVLCSSTVTVSM